MLYIVVAFLDGHPRSYYKAATSTHNMTCVFMGKYSAHRNLSGDTQAMLRSRYLQYDMRFSWVLIGASCNCLHRCALVDFAGRCMSSGAAFRGHEVSCASTGFRGHEAACASTGFRGRFFAAGAHHGFVLFCRMTFILTLLSVSSIYGHVIT